MLLRKARTRTSIASVLLAVFAGSVAGCGGSSLPAPSGQSGTAPLPPAASQAGSVSGDTASGESAPLRIGDTAHLKQGDRAADVTVLSAKKTPDGTTVRFRV